MKPWPEQLVEAEPRATSAVALQSSRHFAGAAAATGSFQTSWSLLSVEGCRTLGFRLTMAEAAKGETRHFRRKNGFKNGTCSQGHHDIITTHPPTPPAALIRNHVFSLSRLAGFRGTQGILMTHLDGFDVPVCFTFCHFLSKTNPLFPS